MEKEKRGAGTRKSLIGFSLVTFILTFLCWGFSYYVVPGHPLSEFYRFERAEEVVAFLHDNFDIHVTTSEEILVFMAAYMAEDDSCESRPARVSDFAYEIVDENVTEIIHCTVPTWSGFAGEEGYRIKIYITNDSLLEYIEARRYCVCL
jgi:hypothetical protein